jgi:SAM-dependent methyltransferase
MGFYRDRIVPSLVHLAMRNRNLAPYRGRVVSEATGRVLEVGVGSGLNLPFYGESASHVIGLDPSPKLLAMARETAHRTAMPLSHNARCQPTEDSHSDASPAIEQTREHDGIYRAE